MTYLAATNFLQGAKYFYVALVAFSTLGYVLVPLDLTLGAEMLQTGITLKHKEYGFEMKYNFLAEGNTFSLSRLPTLSKNYH